ncbi:hypothetical protein V7S43_015842 [Phytophthora oleae]|uniref:BED-type domain-containing protein n=1 Tax=Phytophthora oleae TaxID=2107226 RepID=A0ABD3EYW1_9STRA
MKCSFVDCVNPELPTLYPCSVCEREVHHLCSNDLDNIAVHFCSASCEFTWKSKTGATSSNTEPAVFEIVGWASGSSRRQQASQSSDSTVTEPEEISSSQSSLESFSDHTSQVDAYGIPAEIHHYRQLGKWDQVWNIAHVLSTPYATGTDDDAERFTHVCVLCALRLTSHPNASEDAWEGALRKFNHTSNVKDHLVAKHGSHPIGKAEASKRVKRARRQLEDAFDQGSESLTDDTSVMTHSAKGF